MKFPFLLFALNLKIQQKTKQISQHTWHIFQLQNLFNLVLISFILKNEIKNSKQQSN